MLSGVNRQVVVYRLGVGKGGKKGMPAMNIYQQNKACVMVG